MKPFLAIILLSAFFLGCATLEKKPSLTPLPKDPVSEKAFQEADQHFQARRYPTAVRAFQDFLQNHTYNYYTPVANFRLGQIFLVHEQWKEAIPYYEASLEKGIFPEWGEKAVYDLALCYFRLGDFLSALRILDRFPPEAEPKLQIRAGSLRVNAGEKAQNESQKIRGYLELVDAYSMLPPADWRVSDLAWAVDHKQAYEGVRAWVDQSKMTIDELKELNRLFSKRSSGAYVLWKIILTVHQGGDYKKAERLAEDFLNRYPKNEYVQPARHLLAELGKRDTSYRPRIGVVLPLSGKYQVYGESVLHGLECANGIFQPCGQDLGVSLEVRDSQGDPKEAVRLIRELQADPEVVALIGPLTQGEADAATSVVEELQIPMIALSQKPDLPNQGDYVFRNFLTIADQVATLVHYTCREKGIKEFAILYPEGPGGEEYLKLFEREVNDCGGQVVGKQSYDSTAERFLAPLRTLKEGQGTYNLDKKRPFEALFFPSVYRRVPALVEDMNFLKLGGIQLLGGAGWDHPELLSDDPKGVEGSIFVNGFFPKSGGFKTKDFVESFQAAYGIEPTILEAYAYDSLGLLASFLRGQPQMTRAEVQKELSAIQNYQGVTGEISFDETGDARRRLFVLTVKEGEIQEVR